MTALGALASLISVPGALLAGGVGIILDSRKWPAIVVFLVSLGIVGSALIGS